MLISAFNLHRSLEHYAEVESEKVEAPELKTIKMQIYFWSVAIAVLLITFIFEFMDLIELSR